MGGEVLVNQARVTTADVAASNGVVHIIDSVLMIPKPNIVQLAERTADLSILVSAVVAGDLADTLSSAGKITVFAPTNEAFKALPAGQSCTFLCRIFLIIASRRDSILIFRTPIDPI